MQNSRPKYDKLGPAAILVSAYAVPVEAVNPSAPVNEGGVACVDVRGPLTHHQTFGLDCYDAVLARVRAAVATEAHTVLLKLDSPGGDVYGCFETARAIRAAAAAGGKKLVAYVDGRATSAAYALACAADEIVVPATGCVGSIGVVDMLASVARQDAAMGIDVAVVTSGARKADGNPHVPLSEGALAAHQAHVDELAAVFYAWVAERRPLSVEAVRGLEAALFVGASALAAGLVDQVADFLDLRGTLTATARNVPQGNQTMGAKASKYTDAMAALAALAEEGDEDAKKAMKKMLGTSKAESDDKDSGDGDKKEAKAESDDGDKKDKDAAGAKASTEAALSLASELAALKNQIAAKEEAAERSTLLASRPDLAADPKMSAWLASASIEVVRQAVNTIPKASLTPVAPVNPTVGASQSVGLPADEARELRIRMGLESHPRATVTKTDNLMIFGGTPSQIAARLGEGK